MKLEGNLMKLIIFMIASGIVTSSTEFYMISRNLTTLAIISGTIFEIFLIYVLYKLVME